MASLVYIYYNNQQGRTYERAARWPFAKFPFNETICYCNMSADIIVVLEYYKQMHVSNDLRDVLR